MKETHTLVVGQGIAGSMAAFMLHQLRIPFMVIDPGFTNTSSKIAAGMFTPISGKRKTILPFVGLQILFAMEVYRKMEMLVGKKFLYPDNVYQVHSSLAEQAEWDLKAKQDGYAKMIQLNPPGLVGIKQPFGACEITESGWVDCRGMIVAFADWLRMQEILMEKIFIYKQLVIEKNRMSYQDIYFTNIIFCEGYRAGENPFFKEQIIPCKGDILTVECANISNNHIIKKQGLYLVNNRDGSFKAGATYQWNNCNEAPDAVSKRQIQTHLNGLLKEGYKISNHQSAIRPTTQNREVIVKQHPEYKGMFMLNGLGTKGVLQAPWWADRLVRLIALQK